MALERALRGYDNGNRLVSSAVLLALQKRFGYGFGRYARDEVAPRLIKRDLLIRADGKSLGLFPRIGYRRTPRGDALIAPLERLMVAVERIPSVITSDPEHAIHLARSAGFCWSCHPKRAGRFQSCGKCSPSDSLFDGLDVVGNFTSGGDSSSSDGGDGGGD